MAWWVVGSCRAAAAFIMRRLRRLPTTHAAAGAMHAAAAVAVSAAAAAAHGAGPCILMTVWRCVASPCATARCVCVCSSDSQSVGVPAVAALKHGYRRRSDIPCVVCGLVLVTPVQSPCSDVLLTRWHSDDHDC